MPRTNSFPAISKGSSNDAPATGSAGILPADGAQRRPSGTGCQPVDDAAASPTLSIQRTPRAGSPCHAKPAGSRRSQSLTRNRARQCLPAAEDSANLTITIEEFHAAMDDYLRCVSTSHTSLIITEHGEPIAALSNPASITPISRKRVLLPEYEAMIANAKISRTSTLQEDLDEIRGDR